MAQNKRGKQRFVLPHMPVITAWASVAGKKESEGPLAQTFDIVSQDTYFGQKTWEQAEKQMQKMAIDKVMEKAGISANQVGLVFSGDLLNQCIGSSFSLNIRTASSCGTRESEMRSGESWITLSIH